MLLALNIHANVKLACVGGFAPQDRLGERILQVVHLGSTLARPLLCCRIQVRFRFCTWYESRDPKFEL